MISGMPVPLRLHQEDFAQAMGIPADEKYEEQKSGYLGMMMNTLAKYSADPIAFCTCFIGCSTGLGTGRIWQRQKD